MLYIKEINYNNDIEILIILLKNIINKTILSNEKSFFSLAFKVPDKYRSELM